MEKSYLLVRWPEHLAKVFRSTVKEVVSVSRDFFERESDYAIFWYLAAAGAFVSGIAVALILAIVQALVLSVASAGAYLLLAAVYSADFLYRRIKNWRLVCPYCRARIDLPGYLCPSCKKEYARLVPGVYGIFKRKCSCGTELPTTSFNGRDELTPFCPHCGEVLNPEFNRTKPVVISVAGSVGAGKTTLTLLLARVLMTRAQEKGWIWRIIKASDLHLLDELKRLDQGFFPAKTAAKMPPAFNLKFEAPDGEAYLVYVFDYAGESFKDVVDVTRFKEHDAVDAMLIVLDPFQPAESERAVMNLLNSLEVRKITVDRAAIVLTKVSEDPEEVMKTKFLNLWNVLQVNRYLREKVLTSIYFDPEFSREGESSIKTSLEALLAELLRNSRSGAAREFYSRLLS